MNALSKTDLEEIRYRSDSTNIDALSGFAKLAATDRRDLLAHIDATRPAIELPQTALIETFALLLRNQVPYRKDPEADEARKAWIEGMNRHASRTRILVLQYASKLGIRPQQLADWLEAQQSPLDPPLNQAELAI